MEALEYKLKSVIILELRGRVDDFNAEILEDELNTITNTGRFRIGINLEKTTYISAKCLNIIWKCKRRTFSYGGDIVLIGGSGKVLETISEVGFAEVVLTFLSNSEAADWFERFANTRVLSEQEIKLLTFHENYFTIFKVIIEILFNKVKKLIHVGILVALFYSDKQVNCATIEQIEPEQSFAGSKKSDIYTLDEVMSLARENSPMVKLARLKRIEKEAEVGIAKSYSFPRIIGTTGYLYQSNPSVMTDIINRELTSARNANSESEVEQSKSRTRFNIENSSMIMGAGIGQIIYSGGLFTQQIVLKESQKKEAEAAIAVENSNIEEQISNLYLGLLLVQEKVKLLNAHKIAMQKKFDAARKANEVKTISDIQFAEIELLNLKAEQEYTNVIREEENVRSLMNIILGRKSYENIVPIAIFKAQDFVPESSEHYFEIALHRYPELKRSMALMDSATAYSKIVSAQSVFSPQALVFGSFEYTKGLGNTASDLNYTFGFGVAMPIFDGKKSISEFDKSTSLISQARMGYEQAERKLRMDIADVVSKLRQGKSQKDLAFKSLSVMQRRKKDAEKAALQGQIPQYKLSEILAQELEANMFLIASEADIYKNYAKLMILIGKKDF